MNSFECSLFRRVVRRYYSSETKSAPSLKLLYFFTIPKYSSAGTQNGQKEQYQHSCGVGSVSAEESDWSPFSQVHDSGSVFFYYGLCPISLSYTQNDWLYISS